MNFQIRKWLPTRVNRLTLEAISELAHVRILRTLLRFSKLATLFGEPQVESPSEIEAEKQSLAHDIGLAIRRAARFAPFQCNCLTQAICGLRMLKRRRISCTLYLGVTHGTDASKEAHAWLRSGTSVITGESELNRYDAVFQFAIQ